MAWDGSWLKTYRDVRFMHELYLAFELRYVLYVLMGSFVDYEFSSRWRLLMVGDLNRVLIVVVDELKSNE